MGRTDRAAAESGAGGVLRWRCALHAGVVQVLLEGDIQ